jgi:thymidylate kinase
VKTYGKHRFPGRLFVVEGIDGSGKSTQLALLQKWLESEGYGTFFSQWNSSALVSDVTRRGKFAVKPTVAVYFRISVDEAMKRIMGGRDAINYYEAGMDQKLSGDIEESFRLF